MDAMQKATKTRRYSLVITSNVILVMDDYARRIVDNFPPEQEDAAWSYLQDLNNGEATP